MSKASDWVNWSASVAVILGIVFLGMEINQNTEMMKSQTRDSISEKQMMFSEWVATEIELAETIAKATAGQALTPAEGVQYAYFLAGVWREWENSYYQFQQGLFDRDEFEPRMNRWHDMMRTKLVRDSWLSTRMNYAPSFRTEVDRIVSSIDATAEVSARN